MASSFAKPESLKEIIRSLSGDLPLYGGEYCKNTDVNQYLMPQKEFNSEEPCSVYAYHVQEGYFSFIRVFVDHINPHSREVTLNLAFVKLFDVKTS